MASIFLRTYNFSEYTTDRRATRIISTSIVIITCYFFMLANFFFVRITPVISTLIGIITIYRSFNPTTFRITISYFTRGQSLNRFIPTTPGSITVIISTYIIIITVNIFMITSTIRVAGI